MDHSLPSGVSLREAALFLLFIVKCIYFLNIVSFLTFFRFAQTLPQTFGTFLSWK